MGAVGGGQLLVIGGSTITSAAIHRFDPASDRTSKVAASADHPLNTIIRLTVAR